MPLNGIPGLAAPGVLLDDRYLVIKKIGAGNFGSCWLSEDAKKGGLQCVVKQVVSGGSVSDDDLEEAKREAQLLSTLAHQHIITFFAQFVTADCVNIVTEFCDGGDLAAAISSQQEKMDHQGNVVPFGQQLVLSWTTQLTAALSYMHAKRILHRDVKTKNIFLLKSKGHRLVKLGDFGIAKSMVAEAENTQSVAGTPFYMSPECLKGTGYNDKSDVWALACVLYELCMLRPPFNGDSLMSLMYNICEGAIEFDLPPCYSDGLRHLLEKLFDRNPDARPSAASILAFPVVREHIRASKHRMRKHKTSRRPRGQKTSALSTAHTLLSAGGLDAHCTHDLVPETSVSGAASLNESPKARKQRLKSQRAAEKKANKEAKLAAKKERKASKRRASLTKKSRKSCAGETASANEGKAEEPTADGQDTDAFAGTFVVRDDSAVDSQGTTGGATTASCDDEYKLGVQLLRVQVASGDLGNDTDESDEEEAPELNSDEDDNLSVFEEFAPMDDNEAYVLSEGYNSLDDLSVEDQEELFEQIHNIVGNDAAFAHNGDWLHTGDARLGVAADMQHTSEQQRRGDVMAALGSNFEDVYSYLAKARANHFDDRDIHAFLAENYPNDVDACMRCDRLVHEDRFRDGATGMRLGDVVMYS
eukprot:m.497130 g.497130  ORF g.497130 m.497130 type:complete len:645 (+) comp21813_c1_seq4:293-2227(+)